MTAREIEEYEEEKRLAEEGAFYEEMQRMRQEQFDAGIQVGRAQFLCDQIEKAGPVKLTAKEKRAVVPF